LWRSASGAAPDERDDLLLEAYEIARFVATTHPEWHADAADSPYRTFLDRIAASISKSGKL
jgi:hypothetical protein